MTTMTQVISVLGTKGGTSKTTTTIMLATALASKGKRVLVLDSDLQRDALEWAERAGKEIGFTAKATPTTQTLNTALARNSSADLDYIIVDTPPGSNSIINAAATSSDLALIPTGVSDGEIRQVQKLIGSLAGSGTPIAIVLSNVDKRVKDGRILHESLQAHERAAVADALIPMRNAIRKSYFKLPQITTKPFAECMELAEEIESALAQMK